jgi:hypothetical protein
VAGEFRGLLDGLYGAGSGEPRVAEVPGEAPGDPRENEAVT